MERPRQDNSNCLLHYGLGQDNYPPKYLSIDTRRLNTMVVSWGGEWGRGKGLVPMEGANSFIA